MNTPNIADDHRRLKYATFLAAFKSSTVCDDEAMQSLSTQMGISVEKLNSWLDQAEQDLKTAEEILESRELSHQARHDRIASVMQTGLDARKSPEELVDELMVLFPQDDPTREEVDTFDPRSRIMNLQQATSDVLQIVGALTAVVNRGEEGKLHAAELQEEAEVLANPATGILDVPAVPADG